MARACLRVLAWFDPQWPSLKMGVACLYWRDARNIQNVASLLPASSFLLRENHENTFDRDRRRRCCLQR